FLPDATFVIDREGKVIAWNRAMEQLTGSAAIDFLGKGDYTYSVPFYGVRRPILIDIALQADSETEKLYAAMDWIGDTVVGEAYMPNLGSGTSYLWGTATPLRDSRGAIVGAIESIRDITERKRTQDELIRAREELEIRVDERTAELTRVNASLQSEIDERKLVEIALRESQERYRRLVELSPDAIFVHDGEEIVFVNTAGIRLLGVKDDRRIVGVGISEIVNTKTSDTFPVSSGIMGNTKDPSQTFEEEFTRLDHTTVAVEVSSAPIVYKGTPAVLVVARDVTERKKAEEQLRLHATEMSEKNKELDFLTNQLLDMNQDLDLRVRERTEQVIRLMKQKDDFITQIGHDLKTPLTPLRALLPSLIEDEKNPEIRNSMAVLLRSVHSIQEQTDKILTIARLNRDDIMAKPEEVILYPILHDSIQKNWLFVQKKIWM
ncbi:MAG: PAS domain S-box protein, partial [Methanospirillum sp.]|uniref:PAS domain-containing protein n=1 Tax=Methanospirillum sp. TaxID=45200 RepID=UPI002373BDE6